MLIRLLTTVALTIGAVTCVTAPKADEPGVAPAKAPGTHGEAPLDPTTQKPAAPPAGTWEAILHDTAERLKQPYKGVTEAGKVEEGLFSIRSTGISTAPVRTAAQRYLDSLSQEQRAKNHFPIDHEKWRTWSNMHRYPRTGVKLGDMTEKQRSLALEVLKASLSARGLRQTEDIMRLNGHLGELTGKPEEYSSGHYWLNIFATPSTQEPWGWQLDGHHLSINYFVLGDQVVITPMFFGSEPVAARHGPMKGRRAFDREEAVAGEFMRMLTASQRQQAILSDSIPKDVFTLHFRDNFELRYEGIKFTNLTTQQQKKLWELIDVFITRQRKEHAGVWRREVQRHQERLYFAWMGGTGPTDVFYYRIHSPVILIEFDHQPGLAIDKGKVSREHVHTVVRTPNGNDYGKDLLRQHYLEHDHSDGKTHDGR